MLSNLQLGSVGGILTLLSIFIGLFTITSFLFHLLALISSKVLKAFSVFMVIGNSFALYFILSYQVILDRSMMGNVFNTDSAEAFSYYHPKIFLYIVIFGLIPAYLLTKITFKNQKRLATLKYAFITLISGILLMYLNSTTWLWIDKYAKRIGGLVLPWSYTINSIRYQAQQLEHSKKQELLPNATIKNNNKMVVVLVIGESARVGNFSLYGYQRETNPELKKLDVLALKNATASATYTTASVHSMLSYKGDTSDNYEPLPNYLQRTGVDVIWRSKNWGEPTLKIQTYERDTDLKASCKGDDCDMDGVLLTGLKERIISSKQNKVFVVLHTSGSHGPTYYTKYPSRFEIFKPGCKTVELKECSQQQLVNSYDNTIVYTDYFLSQVIKMLKELKDTPSTMIYMSDHGESLGEKGLYLHGTPFAFAPDVQKKIPFIIWESKSFMNEKKATNTFVKPMNSYGQSNIFHTILGAFGIETSIYDEKQDLFGK